VGERSKIEWTDATFNPWRGCTKVSPACANCYAENDLSVKLHGILWGDNAQRAIKAESGWEQPLAWNRKAEREGRRMRVFCGSLCDVFEDRPELVKPRFRLYDLIEETPWLFWLLLTKRPQHIARIWRVTSAGIRLNNVGLGVTVESDDYTWRIAELLRCPAALHFVSAEPMLGGLDLRPWLPVDTIGGVEMEPLIRWVIAGAESGPKRRPTDIAWIRSLRDQAVTAGIPFLLKQAEINGRLEKSPELDGKQWLEVPEMLAELEAPGA